MLMLALYYKNTIQYNTSIYAKEVNCVILLEYAPFMEDFDNVPIGNKTIPKPNFLLVQIEISCLCNTSNFYGYVLFSGLQIILTNVNTG